MILGGLLFAALFAAGPSPDAHRAEIESWRARRMASLKKDDGWLTLVGLFWLEQGENRFGGGKKGNRIVFPEGSAPASAGSLDLAGETVTIHAKPEANLTAG
ncbi:MAG TPA: hypothetical protein VKH43_00820, partial [Thermoanaerobaculia bacterium]|nr:hypothetical protein [Thermoanaerobaculia bacterium]